ncbi:Helix-turn-helix domain protein [Gimesia aquarii]|uniref:Helix-turn-helix domain protein n=1 Tax=Gimesia aquarii TaxID=2527964 RepID=A0A517VTB3_9PLAN|nr:Helix-turn-helix domain protein [Gimesia aquarii]
MGKKSAKRSSKRATSKRSTSKTRKTAKKQASVKKTEPVKCIIGFTAAAERWDVSDKTIQNWIKKGLPVSGTQRKRVFDVSECDAWVASYRDEKADRDSQKLNEELKKEKLLQEKLKRKDLERKDLIADEKLISREEYELFAAECVIEARDQMLTLPKEMRRHLCKKCQSKVKEMQTMIEQALQRLSEIEEGPKK